MIKPEINTGRTYTIPCLDGIRGISFLLVFVAHSAYGKIIPNGLGLTMFFFLSGYLITHLLVKEYESKGHVSVTKFYLRRTYRIVPPMLAVLALCILIELSGFWGNSTYTIQGIIDTVLYLGVYGNIFLNHSENIVRGSDMFWTLAVEEHFYLLFPVFFLLLKKYVSLSKTIYIFLVLFGLAAIFRYIAHYVYEVDYSYIHEASHLRFDSIMFGAMLAMCHDPMKKSYAISRRLNILLLIAGAELMLYTFVNRSEDFRATIRYSLQGVGLYVLFYVCVANPDWVIFRWLNKKLFVQLGVLSYGLYLFHWLIMNMMGKLLPSGQHALHFALSLLLTIGLAYLLNISIEKPFTRLRQRLHG